MPLYVSMLLVTGAPEEAESAARAHEGQLRELKSAGTLRAAGVFRDGDGYLEIFEAGDLLEAEAIASRSPLVERGLATRLLREWIELDL